ncbi:MAG TPA: TIGR03842 family LLM class F420-dependent oxidoreductase [Solirubrobacter sp.]|nr:TIGR03842 family LLM class F420-dependent oxidoreductase [Solirubrobacter sp.]
MSIFPPARAALDRLRLAERLGFDTFWVTDSHVIWNECYSLLGWLIGQAEDPKIEFGTMVTNPVSRDPIVIASAFATLQDLSGGRMLCGIGRGDSAVRVLKRRPATVKAFEAAARTIETLARGGAVQTEAGETRIEWATGGKVPVYVAAYGPRMLDLAGRVGDGVIIECADPAYLSWAMERVHAGAQAEGRDPASLAIICTTTTFVSDDLAAAREQVRPVAALVGNHVAEVMRNLGPGSMPAELEAFVAERPDYDYMHHVQRGEQADYIPDEMVDRLCLVGSAQHCATRIEELRQLGVTHLNLYDQTDDFEGQMALYAAEVLPRLSPNGTEAGAPRR